MPVPFSTAVYAATLCVFMHATAQMKPVSSRAAAVMALLRDILPLSRR